MRVSFRMSQTARDWLSRRSSGQRTRVRTVGTPRSFALAAAVELPAPIGGPCVDGHRSAQLDAIGGTDRKVRGVSTVRCDSHAVEHRTSLSSL